VDAFERYMLGLGIATATLVLLSSVAKADPLIRLTDLSIETTQYIHGRHNDRFNGHHQEKFGLNLNMGLRSSKYIYTRTKIKSATDDRQFRYVALEVESGLQMGQFDLYVHHESQHLLDAEYDNGFKDDNRVGIRLTLYKEK
jgi:hypothetical protein